MALAVRVGVLCKGGESRTPRRVSETGEGLSRRSESISERLGTRGTRGVSGATRPEGYRVQQGSVLCSNSRSHIWGKANRRLIYERDGVET